VSAITTNSVTLTWTASTPATVAINHYHITYFRAFNDVIWETDVGNVTTATITANITAAAQFQFTVAGVDDNGQTSQSTAFVVTVTPATDTGPDTTPPSAPANLAVSSTTSTDATLTWSPSTDDVGVTGYNVYRFDGVFVSTLVTTVTGTTATVALAAAPNQYYVRARDAVGNVSIASNRISTNAPTSPSAPPSTSPTCRVTYALQSQWSGGFVANITISNLGSTAINGWTLVFTYQGDQQIRYAWNATVSQTGAAVTATGPSWNANIPAGGNVSFGVQGVWTSSLAAPGAYSVNGVSCAIG